MAVNTPEGFKGDLSAKVIAVLQALFDSLAQDEAGNVTLATGAPYHVTVTNTYADVVVPWPSCAILIDYGLEPAGMSNQKLDEMDDGTPIYGFYAPSATIHCTVTGRRDAERTYLANYLESGIQQAVWIDPATAQRYDGVLKYWLGALNVTYKGLRVAPYQPPDPRKARPEGEAFEADVQILCGVMVSWLGGLGPPTTSTIATNPLMPDVVSTSFSL